MWRETTLLHVIKKNPDKTRLDCLEILFDTLLKMQRGLNILCQEDNNLRDEALNACQGIPECKMAFMKPAPTFEGVCEDLRSAINNEAICNNTLQYLYTNFENDINWTDRTYEGKGKTRPRNNYSSRSSNIVLNSIHPQRTLKKFMEQVKFLA